MGRKRMEPSKAVTSPVTERCSFSMPKRALLHSTSGLRTRGGSTAPPSLCSPSPASFLTLCPLPGLWEPGEGKKNRANPQRRSLPVRRGRAGRSI